MRDTLNKHAVMVEVLDKEPIILTITHKKFVKARILQIGSEVEADVKENDLVVCHNEGREIIKGNSKVRIVGELALLYKFTESI